MMMIMMITIVKSFDKETDVDDENIEEMDGNDDHSNALCNTAIR